MKNASKDIGELVLSELQDHLVKDIILSCENEPDIRVREHIMDSIIPKISELGIYGVSYEELALLVYASHKGILKKDIKEIHSKQKEYMDETLTTMSIPYDLSKLENNYLWSLFDASYQGTLPKESITGIHPVQAAMLSGINNKRKRMFSAESLNPSEISVLNKLDEELSRSGFSKDFDITLYEGAQTPNKILTELKCLQRPRIFSLITSYEHKIQKEGPMGIRIQGNVFYLV